MARPFPPLRHPIVQAPMAGGPSTPELAAAVSGAGGFGFLAAGYRSAGGLAQDIERVRALTSAPFGVNLFLVAETEVDGAALAAYTETLRAAAAARGAQLGEPRFDDDALAAKLDLVQAVRPAVVSFTFGCPDRALVERLHGREIAVWVTVTEVEEARTAARAGADALVVQGVEAGGHRGTFADRDGEGEIGLLALLHLVATACPLPLVASGAVADGAGVAAVLAAGAQAAQIGTGFMRCPEAATVPAHRAALAAPGATAITRTFSGRRARGIVNAFIRAHPDAPSAYPHIHHLTSPLRAAARQAGDGEAFNLWAGQAHELAPEAPAAELVARWGAQARAALRQAADRYPE
jgi:nitronate monooxygenase